MCADNLTLVRVQVFAAASMKMTVFWDVAPRLIEIDRYSSTAYIIRAI
jgi:hypothetical protein